MEDSFNGMYVGGLPLCEKPMRAVDLECPSLILWRWSDAPVFLTSRGNDASLYERLIFTNNTQLGTNPYLRNGRSGDEYNAFLLCQPPG